MATRKKASAKKAPAKRVSAKRSPARKSPAKKAAAKKTAARKSTAKNSVARRKPATGVPAKRSAKRSPIGTGRGALRRRRQPESLRLRSILPAMTVDDLGRSIEFYTRALGFVVGERWTGDDGVQRGVMLQAGTCSIGLAQDDWAKGRDRKKGIGMRIWCETAQDLDALAGRIRAAGAEPIGPELESWGSRVLSVVDPDGYQLSFSGIRSR